MGTHMKKILSMTLTVIILFGTVLNTARVVGASSATRDIEVVLAADAVSNNLDLTGFSEKLKNELNSKYSIPVDKVHVTAVESAASSTNTINWYRFDHTNNASSAVNDATNLVSYYNESYSNLRHDAHISVSGNRIDFYGYGVPAYKDFLLNINSNANNKIFTFTIDDANTSYHSGEGAGFIFNAKYTYTSSSDRTLSGYFVIFGQYSVYLYRVENVQISQFSNEASTNLASAAYSVGNEVSKWGGKITLLGSVTKPTASSGTLRYLKLVASPTELSFYQFTSNDYGTVKDKMFESFALTKNFSQFSFGPIGAYNSHSCNQDTRFTFDNITLTEDTSVGFADIVRSTNWQYPDSMKVFVNMDNDGVADFGSTDKLSSILYYTMLNNAHYVGWGLNNTISIGGYTSVKAQSDGFVTRNNGKGTFVNRSASGSTTLDEGVSKIAEYIAGQLSGIPDISKPNLTTRISGGNVTCTATDTQTSNGNPISNYDWKCLDIASGAWSTQSGNTNANTFTFPQNTYKMIGLRIQDSVTAQWSDWSYAYIATVANVAPVSQFTLDRTTLMPDTIISELSGSVVTASDTSYLPNGGQITDWEWTVYDKNLTLIPAMTKSYTSSSIPSSIQFDFTGKSSGVYTIKLRTKNGSAGWSNYYSQQLTIYSENTAITISTTNNTASPNVYTGSCSIPISISSTGGNITSYRLIKVLPGSTTQISDWTKNTTATVSTSVTLTDTTCKVYVQAIDAAGNTKTQFVGEYQVPPSINAVYFGTNVAYTDNTPTNKDVTITAGSANMEYSVDNGSTWTSCTTPITANTTKKYIFRYIGSTDPDTYVVLNTKINKTFQGSLSGIVNNSFNSANVTPVVSNATATISKDGATATAFTSNTTLSTNGVYTIVLTDEYGNTGTYTFTIDKTAPTISASGNATTWTPNDVVLGLSTTVGISGIKSVTVTKDSNPASLTTITGQSSYTVTSNGTYTFTITNKADVSVSTSVTVNKIDKATPVVSINSIRNDKGNYSYSSVLPSESDVVFTLVDAGSCISGVTYYSSTNGTDWTPISGSAFTVSNTSNITKNYYFKAVSGAGKTSQTTSAQPVYISKPTFTEDIVADMTLSDNSVYTGGWANQDIAIALSGGINSESFLKYQYSTTPSDPSSWQDMGGTGKNELAITDETNAVYYFRVVSLGGSIGDVSTGTDIKLDKTAPTDIAISFEGNEFKSFINSVTFNLFYRNSIDVSIQADSNISGIARYEYQLVNTSLGQSYNADGVWTTYTSLTVSPQFQGVIYARAIDNAGNVSSVVSTTGITVDDQEPNSPTVSATAGGQAYSGDWTSGDVTIILSGSSALSGINHYEYKSDADADWSYMPEQTGVTDSLTGAAISNKLVISDNVNATYSFRAVSNSGVTGAVSTLIVKKDDSIPQTSVSPSGTVDQWTQGSVTFDLSNLNGSVISAVSYWIKVGSGDWVELSSPTYTFDSEINEPVSFKSVTESGVENIFPTVYQVMIDRTAPDLSGANGGQSYYIGRIINYSDSYGELASATYSIDGGSSFDLNSGDLMSTPGSYVVTIVDKAGNSSTLSFTVLALPSVSDVVYTSDCYAHIRSIRSEFDQHSDLSDPYKTATDEAIKQLENRYAQLEAEVNQIKQETIEITSRVNALVPANDGLIGMLSVIQAEYDKIAGSSSTLTAEQKAALSTQKAYLKSLLDTIAVLQNQVAQMVSRTNVIPTSDDGLIAQKDVILQLISDMKKLTNEQQTILNPQLSILSSLLDKIDKLMGEVNDIITRTQAVSTADEGLISRKPVIEQILKDISKLTTEQQSKLASQSKLLTDLLAKIDKLNGQVTDIVNRVNSIPTDPNGLVAQKDTIENLKKEIGTLTKEQQDLLKPQLDTLNGLLSQIDTLQNQTNDIVKRVDALPKADDGLIARKADINQLLADINKLTDEQKKALAPQIATLNGLLDKIATLQGKVDEIKNKVNSIPTNDNDLPGQKSVIESLIKEIGTLTTEQQQLLASQVESLKSLLNQIATLDSEVQDIISRTNSIPTDADGLISHKAEIEQLIQDISQLSDKQQSELQPQLDKLKGLLNTIDELNAQVQSIEDRYNKLPKSDDGLIAQQSAIEKLLKDISGLTGEQKNKLKGVADNLNGLLTKINTLKKQVDDAKEAIDQLPAPDKITKSDADKVNKAKDLYGKLNNEQKALFGEERLAKLNQVVEALVKLMLYDAPNDVTVTGIDGTTFSPNTYLVVTPIESKTAPEELDTAKSQVQEAAKKIDAIQDKELVALYDVSMFTGNVKVQPDGKVQVKIKIPDSLAGRTGLDIIHIADDGTVTMMNAKVVDGYLVFVTDHFSKYGIIANHTCIFGICKALGIYDRNGGKCVDWYIILSVAIVILLAVSYIVYRNVNKRRRENKLAVELPDATE